jgi:hypothetical protein
MDNPFLNGTYKNSLKKIIVWHGVFPTNLYLLKSLSHVVTGPLKYCLSKK